MRAPTTVRVPAPTPTRPASHPRLGLGQSASGLTDHQAVTQVCAPFHTSAAVADLRTIPSSPAPAVSPKSTDALLGPVAVPAAAVKDKVQLLTRNFSKGPFVSCNRKNSLYKQFQTNPTESNKSRYNKYRNKYNFLIRVARKKKHFHDKLVSVSSDLRKTRSVIKQIISKQKSEQHFSSMKHSTGVCSDPSRIATNFNNFFANIGPSLASKVPSTQFSHKDFLVGHFADCFFLNPTSPAQVASIVHSLKHSKCEGVDGLSMSTIKETIDLPAAALSHICNLSFELGGFPDKLKIAKILPVSKSDDASLFSSYRPIYILFYLHNYFGL